MANDQMRDRRRDRERLIAFLYEMAPGYTEPPEKMDDQRILRIANLADLETDDPVRIREYMYVLQRMGLYGQESSNIPGHSKYMLTRKGFDVAHQLDLERRRQNREERRAEQQQKYNGMLTGFTLILAVTSGLQVIASLVGAGGIAGIGLALFSVVVLAVLTLGVVEYPSSWRRELGRLGETDSAS